ncbi:hypothetical protein B0T26DRAFT_650713 [Lasiosphaeria miniovina]|uniref:Uncharacterized protein n=1 Tax=Lasiosphaeria miniovina TaxID=1954250 RepID=A0AA40ADV8_9PEZI|nr:uncharacterized protein B0T26DRAFT_650713 [Lasiosphaeria miniovina]KAK0714030.1 hypothetical protein B0T26DRAFT_650713 [Lasiosphaeria miniovina]
MGANLAIVQPFDTSKAVLSPTDRYAQIILGALWAGSLYGIGMIFCSTRLMSRWAGSHGEKEVGFVGFIAAFILSVAWPAILVYFAVENR